MLPIFFLPALHVVVLSLIALRIFSRRSAHGTAIAWLLLVIMIPGVGMLMYLLIGERRLGRLWMRRARQLRPQIEAWAATIRGAGSALPEHLSPGSASVSRMAQSAVGLPPLGGHRLQLLADSEAIMRAMIADIDAAQSSVHMEFYIWSTGGFVDDLVAALVRAAQRGVACAALMDSLGSRPFFKTAAYEQLRRAGVKLVEVLPVSPLRVSFVRFDLRDHRKIAVSPTPAA